MVALPDLRPEHAMNRASWELMAAAHGQDAYYDTASFLDGKTSFIGEEETALAAAFPDGVARLDVLHVQCHLGFNSVELARRGARVVGADFSPTALEKAGTLARSAGVPCEWVQADATSLPESLHARFDLAWATIGVLCWIADVPAWMRSVAATLKPGGQLILIDGHPLGQMVEDVDPLTLWIGYGGGVGVKIEEGTDYATGTPVGAQVQYSHSLGEIVTAASAAGLRVLELVEHADISENVCALGPMRREQDGRHRLRVDGRPLPVLFTLRAGRV